MFDSVKSIKNLRVETDERAIFISSGVGRLANLITLEHAKDLVRKPVLEDTELRNYAFAILKNNELDSHSRQQDIINAIHVFVQTKFDYHADPSGGLEAIQSARETLKRGAGDCDDLSILEATLLGHLGIDTAFVAAKYKPQTSGFDHLFLQAVTKDGEKVFLDPTVKARAAGWYKQGALDMLFSPIFVKEWQNETTSPRAHIRTLGRELARGFNDILNVTRPLFGYAHPVFAGVSTVADLFNNPQVASGGGATADVQSGRGISVKGLNTLPVVSIILAAVVGGAIVYYFVRVKK